MQGWKAGTGAQQSFAIADIASIQSLIAALKIFFVLFFSNKLFFSSKMHLFFLRTMGNDMIYVHFSLFM